MELMERSYCSHPSQRRWYDFGKCFRSGAAPA